MHSHAISINLSKYYSDNNGLQLLSYNNNVVTTGSCFAQNMGEKLLLHNFKTNTNILGITFNPIVIANQIENCLNNSFNKQASFSFDNVWFNYLFHSQVYGKTEEHLHNNIANTMAQYYNSLKNADYLFITFGSAHYYWHNSLEIAVANCHKQNQELFTKKIATSNDIVNAYNKLFFTLKEFNPKLNILLSVSPVKYIRDGVIENNVSKAHLLIAANTLSSQNDFVHYFPAFEIVTDVLRNYEYFKLDGAHPNQQAIDFVWKVFSENITDKPTQKYLTTILEIIALKNHKVLNPDTHSTSKLKDLLVQKTTDFNTLYPFNKFN